MNPSSKEPQRLGKEFALRRLNRRECSSHDIRRHLIEKGISPEIAAEVVFDLKEKSIIDDTRFAKILIREQALRGKGPLVVLQKLKAHGILLDLVWIKALMSETTSTSEVETARALIERKYPDAKKDRKVASRAFQALTRRGFSYSIIREALSSSS